MFEKTGKEQLAEMAKRAEDIKKMIAPSRYDRQCPSCGGFCKKGGCERAGQLPGRRLTDGQIEQCKAIVTKWDYATEACMEAMIVGIAWGREHGA